MEKKIASLSAFLSAMGLINMIFNHDFNFGWVANILSFFNLFNYRSSGFLSNSFGSAGGYLEIILEIMFAIGTVIYFSSGYRNFKILRFIYGVLLLNFMVFIPIQILFILSSRFNLIDTTFGSYQVFNFGWLSLTYSLISLAFYVFLLIASYKILRYFNSLLQLRSEVKLIGEHKSISFFETGKLVRFFHFLVDTIICFYVFYTFLSALIYYSFFVKFAEYLESMLGERLSLLLIIFVFRVFYFMFFEGQFRATPAKFLSQTRVMNYDGAEAENKEIFIRTLSRFFPFDSLTFLFGYNLHDNWSSTEVFEEEITIIDYKSSKHTEA